MKKMVLPIAVEDVKREVKILQELTGHENVVQFHNAFEDDSYVYIVMELCEGGELLDRILAKKDSRYTEKDAAVVVRQMLKVAAECHLHGLVHRDMKPENFLFKSTKEDSPLKATDFGLSDFIKPGEKFRDMVGSAYYVAPEVLKRNSGPESDVWSIGVITYILLCGRRPFWDKTEDGIFKEVLRNKPDFRRKPWPTISTSAKDFVKKLLVKDPRARLTAAQALSHPWVREGGDASEIPIDISVLSNMRQFVKYSRLKQFALRALASTIDEEELADLKDQFDAIDVDKNGAISLEEMRQALAKDLPWKLKESLVLEIVQAIDSNTDGLVDFTEFVAAALHVHQLEEHNSEKWQLRSQAAFEKFDIDRDGYITPEELRMHSGLRGSIDPLLEEADTDKDGRISLSEFRRLLRTASMSSQNVPSPSEKCGNRVEAWRIGLHARYSSLHSSVSAGDFYLLLSVSMIPLSWILYSSPLVIGDCCTNICRHFMLKSPVGVFCHVDLPPHHPWKAYNGSRVRIWLLAGNKVADVVNREEQKNSRCSAIAIGKKLPNCSLCFCCGGKARA
ncbi:hypothetical protein OIU84_029792 [Salix udensis]|uniref:non-specific serine/threonine protein kinase n=1 Tax=Salix udensis TaxID=889485 RepID=A0AAD6KAM0_9ROSI|nr:hypothetical protein OIU84_029792 [Salix udensis]